MVVMPSNPPEAQGAPVVCLHSGHHPIPWIIRWFSHSAYSHVSLLLPDGAHLEAREFAGVVRHPEFTPKRYETVDFYQLTGNDWSQDQWAAFNRFVGETIDEPYDYITVAEFALGARRSRPSPTAWFCSEWVFAALEAAGVKLVRSNTPWRLTPGDISLSPYLCPGTAPKAPRPSVYL